MLKHVNTYVPFTQASAMWHGVPFRPRESNAPLTAPSEFALATIARASERQAFDQHMEEKWQAIEVRFGEVTALLYHSSALSFMLYVTNLAAL